MTQVESLIFSLRHPGLLHSRANARRFDAHLHATYSLVALKRGTATVRSNRWSRTVHAGDVFLFNPFEVHSASADEPVEYETFYFSKEFLNATLSAADRGESLNAQTDVLPRCGETAGLVEALLDHPGGNSFAEDIEAHLAKALRLCAFAAEPSALAAGTLAHRASLLIRENCTRAIRTGDLAKVIGVHKSHLVRAFKTAIGIAPQTYVRQVRVAKARELICSGHRLSDVAQMLEFSDQAHLTREFKKVFGVPPGALSRQLSAGAPHPQFPGDANDVQYSDGGVT